jgi:hypothetical protein
MKEAATKELLPEADFNGLITASVTKSTTKIFDKIPADKKL